MIKSSTNRTTAVCRVALLTALASASLSAQITTLTFEGLGNLEPVLNFYNGGLGGSGSGPGVNYGVSFSPDALAIIDSDAPGGTGNFGGEPSPSTVLFFLASSAVMNYPTGFDTGFSFYYSSVFNPVSVSVYDGINKTGNLLATIPLAVTSSDGGDPSGSFSPFFPVGVSFSGTARSVDFGGAANQVGFDNITFGSAVPTGVVPEPSTYAALVAVAAIGGHQWYRRRKAA